MTDRAKPSETRSAGANRVRKHREKMKAAGLKPVTLWLPDVNAPGFREDIRRQCRLLNGDPQEEKILLEIEQLSDNDGWK